MTISDADFSARLTLLNEVGDALSRFHWDAVAAKVDALLPEAESVHHDNLVRVKRLARLARVFVKVHKGKVVA